MRHLLQRLQGSTKCGRSIVICFLVQRFTLLHRQEPRAIVAERAHQTEDNLGVAEGHGHAQRRSDHDAQRLPHALPIQNPSRRRE